MLAVRLAEQAEYSSQNVCLPACLPVCLCKAQTPPYRLVTLAELAKMLGGPGDQSKLDPNRQPICLLLGGGMAAGKSTVRKIIGEAEFWTRVSHDNACRLILS